MRLSRIRHEIAGGPVVVVVGGIAAHPPSQGTQPQTSVTLIPYHCSLCVPMGAYVPPVCPTKRQESAANTQTSAPVFFCNCIARIQLQTPLERAPLLKRVHSACLRQLGAYLKCIRQTKAHIENVCARNTPSRYLCVCVDVAAAS